jgi:hypothetical protein
MVRRWEAQPASATTALACLECPNGAGTPAMPPQTPDILPRDPSQCVNFRFRSGQAAPAIHPESAAPRMAGGGKNRRQKNNVCASPPRRCATPVRAPALARRRHADERRRASRPLAAHPPPPQAQCRAPGKLPPAAVLKPSGPAHHHAGTQHRINRAAAATRLRGNCLRAKSQKNTRGWEAVSCGVALPPAPRRLVFHP